MNHEATSEIHDSDEAIDRAIADLKAIEKAIKGLKEAKALAKRLRKLEAEGKLTSDQVAGFLGRASKLALAHAQQVTELGFALGQGDDADRDYLAAKIAERTLA